MNTEQQGNLGSDCVGGDAGVRTKSDLAHRLSYAAYSWGFEAGKVGQSVDTTIAGNKAKDALDALLVAINDSDGQHMTLRDRFAARAMQGLLASEVHAPMDEFVDRSYAIADAMLKARSRA